MLKIHFIDVGYGDAVLIEMLDGRAILIDAGDEENAQRLVRYLSFRGLERLEALVITHPHDNHFGGVPAVMGRWPVGHVYVNGDVERANESHDDGYNDLIATIKRKSVPVVVLKAGDRLPLDIGDIDITVLHPLAIKGSINENSMALWLNYREISFLLSADIQPPQQDKVLDLYPQVKSAKVVLIPHHGGKISAKFAQAFQEDAVFIVSTGPNRYGKPFVEELGKFKGRIYRTDTDGAIVVSSDGTKIEVDHGHYLP